MSSSFKTSKDSCVAWVQHMVVLEFSFFSELLHPLDTKDIILVVLEFPSTKNSFTDAILFTTFSLKQVVALLKVSCLMLGKLGAKCRPVSRLLRR